MNFPLLNSVLADNLGNRSYRVVNINDQQVVLFCLPADPFSQSRDLRFCAYSMKRLQELMAKGQLVILEEHPYWPRDIDPSELVLALAGAEGETKAPQDPIAIRNRRVKAVKQVLAGKGISVLLGSGKRKAFQVVADEQKCSAEAVGKWMATYLTLGMVDNALLPAFDRRGGKGGVREPGEVKRGRPVVYEGSGGSNLSPARVEHIKDFLTKGLEGMKSVEDSYQKYCQVNYSSKGVGERGQTTAVFIPHEERPSLESFQKIFTSLDFKDKAVGRFGLSAWNNNMREVVGNEAARAMLPGAVYQVDFTRCNLICCDETFRHPIGRPAMGLMCDVASPMITALRLSMANPSEEEAFLLCEQAFLPKVPYCRSVGVEIEESDWPVHGVPNKICADNGEFSGKRVSILTEILGIIFENTRAWTATDKGTVESKFNRIKNHEIKFLPGYAPRRRERGEPICDLDNLISPAALRTIMTLILLDIIQDVIENRFMPIGAIREDRLPTGLDLWNWSLESGLGALRPAMPADELRLLFLPQGRGYLNFRGIKFKGLRYASKELIKSGYLAKRKGKGHWVVVAYEPALIDCIYVILDGKEVLPCFLAEKEMAMYGSQGMSFEDVAYIQRRRKGNIMKLRDYNLQRKSDRKAAVDDIIAQQKDVTQHVLHTVTYSIGKVTAASMRYNQRQAAIEDKKAKARILKLGKDKEGPVIDVVTTEVSPPAKDEKKIIPVTSNVAFLRGIYGE